MKHYKKQLNKRLFYHHDDENLNLLNEECILSLFSKEKLISKYQINVHYYYMIYPLLSHVIILTAFIINL